MKSMPYNIRLKAHPYSLLFSKSAYNLLTILLGFGLAICCWGSMVNIFPKYFSVGHFSEIRTVPLDMNVRSLPPEGAGVLRIQIQDLRLEHLANSSLKPPYKSPVVLLEDGLPMKSNVPLDTIRAGCPGCYNHWDSTIWFTPSKGAPQEHTYSLSFPGQLPSADTRVGNKLRELFLPVLLGLAMLCAIVGYIGDHPRFKWHLCLFLLIITSALMVRFRFEDQSDIYLTENWNSVTTYPDSPTYTSGTFRYDSFATLWSYPEAITFKGAILHLNRPPVYPLFMSLTSGASGEQLFQESYPFRWNVTADGNMALVRVARAQKILIALAIVLLSGGLMLFVNPGLVAVGVLYTVQNGFIVRETSSILTEALTQGIMIFAVGCLCFLVKQRKVRWLYALGILAVLAFHTRPAAVFTFLFYLSGLMLILLTANLAQKKMALASVVLVGILALAPAMLSYRATGHLSLNDWKTGPLAKAAIALQVANSNDYEKFEDPQSRSIVKLALEKRDYWRANKATPPSPEGLPDLNYLNSNVENIILAAFELFLNSDDHKFYSRINDIADKLLSLNRLEHFKLWYTQVSVSFMRDSIFKWSPYFTAPTCMLGAVILSIFCGFEVALLVVTIVTAHLLHVATYCAFGVPLDRYLRLTEILIPLAYTLSVGGLLYSKRKKVGNNLSQLTSLRQGPKRVDGDQIHAKVAN
jgi:hypothetical protein